MTRTKRLDLQMLIKVSIKGHGMPVLGEATLLHATFDTITGGSETSNLAETASTIIPQTAFT